MKLFGKFLMLLAIIAVIVLVGWKLLDNTLFGTEDPPVVESSQSLPRAPAPVVEPPTLSTDDVYSSTTGEESLAPSPNLTCEAADDIVGKLYDLRVADKSEEEVLEFISNDENIPDEQVPSFFNFAKSLWATPKEQLVTRETFVKEFMDQCRSVEQEGQTAQ